MATAAKDRQDRKNEERTGKEESSFAIGAIRLDTGATSAKNSTNISRSMDGEGRARVQMVIERKR